MVDVKTVVVSLVAVLSVYLQHGIRAQPTIGSFSGYDSCSQLDEELDLQVEENFRLRSALDRQRQKIETLENAYSAQLEEIRRLNRELEKIQERLTLKIKPESKPKCSTNVTNGSLLTMEWLEVKCVSNISRRDELSMNCRNLNGSPAGIHGLNTDNSISFCIQADGLPVLQSFVCTVTITIPANDSTINYVFNWTSPKVYVLCPVGFDFAAGATGCYRPINELLDWNTANTRCQQLYKGAYSVIVNNAAEHSAISNYMNAKMNSTCHFNDAYAGGFHVWTAGQRQNSSYNSPFVWKPNAKTSLPITYYNWLSSEPSRLPNGNEFCLLLVGTGSYSWHDGSCGLMSCALCEYGPY